MEKTIYEKIDAISGLDITKNAKNPHFKSSYATLEHIMSVLRPLLREEDLMIYHQTIEKEVCTIVKELKGTEYIISRFPLVETDNPQKYGSCISYARRYNVVQIFDIMLHDDNDGNSYNSEQHAQSSFPEPEVIDAETGEIRDDCDKCGNPFVQKEGKFGPFMACSGYPQCKNIKR